MDNYKTVWQEESNKLRVEPSDRLWDHIEVRLENQKLKKKLYQRHWMQIAAAVALLVSAVVWVNKVQYTHTLVVEDFEIAAEDNGRMERFRIIQNSYNGLSSYDSYNLPVSPSAEVN